MHQLADNQLFTVLPLLQSSLLAPAFAYSVVHGVIEGSIVVDDPTLPTLAIISLPAGIHCFL